MSLPVNVGQLIFIPCIVCVWLYPMVSKHQTLLYSCRSAGQSTSVWRQLCINTLWQWKGYTDFLNIGQIVVFMNLNMVLYEILLKYSQFVAESALFFTFCIFLGLPDFGSIAKKGGEGGILALESQIICSLKKSCMKTKVDIVSFTLNSVFLID